MADRRHHLRHTLTVLLATFGSLLMMFTVAPVALAACEDAEQRAQRPGHCVERDKTGRCVIWFDEQIYLGSGNRLPVEKEPLPPDRFKLYALVSPCNGGPAPPHQNSYDCTFENVAWQQFECDQERPDARLPGLEPLL